MTARLFFAIGLVGLLVVACGDDDDESGDSGNYVATCANACNKAHQCDSTQDVNTCSMSCQNEIEDIGPKLSRAYLAAIDACIAEATCAELVVAAVFNTCDINARASLGASASATALCDRAADAAEMCSRPASTVAGCISGVKIFSDSTLGAARACFDRPCDQHTDCVSDALGVQLQ